MLRIQLWQAASFQRSLNSQPIKFCLLKRSPWLDCCSRCRFSTSNRSLVPNSRKVGPTQKSTKTLSKTIESVPQPSRKPATYEPLTEQLATRSSPTVLYRASSYIHYTTACYTTGIFFLGAATLNYTSQNHADLQAVPGYVPVFVSVGSFFIACLGFWMLLKVGVSIVQMIWCRRSNYAASHTTSSRRSAHSPQRPS